MFGLERNKDLCVIFVYENDKKREKGRFYVNFCRLKKKKKRRKKW